jgi:2,4-diaminopentanoate dehydrogenase
MVTDDPRRYRVIQWATGSIGQISIRHFIDNPAFELVGAFVTSPDKDGRDVGEIAGLDPVGVSATRNSERLLELDAHCVNYAPLYADVEELATILRTGMNVVTPVGFVYPKALDHQIVQTLETACQQGGATLHGAGIHPGFAGDLLPTTVSRLCSRIDRIEVQEIAELKEHPSAKMNFEGLGFGRDPDDARANPSPLIHTMESIFRESMLLLADALGVDSDETTTVFDVAVAKRDLEVRSGRISKGTVAGMRHEWITWSGGDPVIVFRSFWKMDDDLDPYWDYGTNKYQVIITGLPSMRVELAPTGVHPTGDIGYWGRVWTAMNAVNAIPAVVAAPTGIKTHLDLPPVRPPKLIRSETNLVW